MKIIKHTFKIPNLKLENGELIEKEPIEKTYTFTLLYKGVGVYEEIANEPLLNTLVSFQGLDINEIVKKVMGTKFILDLASASYTKIENDKFYNNRATCEEFRKLPVASHLNDIQFVIKLLEMATDCLVSETDVNKAKKKIKEEKK